MARAERRSPASRVPQRSIVPLDLAPVLRELIFDRVKTVTLTSATLATKAGQAASLLIDHVTKTRGGPHLYAQCGVWLPVGG